MSTIDTVVNAGVHLCGVGGRPKTEAERALIYFLKFILKFFIKTIFRALLGSRLN